MLDNNEMLDQILIELGLDITKAPTLEDLREAAAKLIEMYPNLFSKDKGDNLNEVIS